METTGKIVGVHTGTHFHQNFFVILVDVMFVALFQFSRYRGRSPLLDILTRANIMDGPSTLIPFHYSSGNEGLVDHVPGCASSETMSCPEIQSRGSYS